MPRGFLVKRQKRYTATSWRRRNSDDERSDSGSEVETSIAVSTRFGSPDSGYCQSPVTLQGLHFADALNNGSAIDNYYEQVDSYKENLVSNPSSPLSLSTYGSPFYFSAFDRLSVSSPQPSKVNFNSIASITGAITTTVSAQRPSPNSPSKKRLNDSTTDHAPKSKTAKKPKAARKISFEEMDKTSPVSGTIIKDWSDSEDEGIKIVSGDIDSSLNCVEVTPEARAELDKIENKLGDYICQLCKEKYDDAFQLAQHRCSRIVHVDYRCPECDKCFNCPANLASHRRWHKPKPNNNNTINNNNNNNNNEEKGRPVKMLTPAMTNLSMTLNNPTFNFGNTLNNLNGNYTLSEAESEDSETPTCPSPLGDFVQTGEGDFECNQCGKRFRRQAYLRKHQATHNDEHPYPCQYCGKLFRSDTSRAKHVLQHAVGTRDFACSVCGAYFCSKASLQKHVRVHGSEVFPCKYCSNVFYSSAGLTRHINKCHPSDNRQVILLQIPPVTGSS